MTVQTASTRHYAWLKGAQEALPLLGGYIPVAISFGLVAIQAGFSAWESIIISILIYAGGSQFLFVGMIAVGTPLWLVVVMSLLINARHLVYAPNIAPWLTSSRWWPWLMHGLTDQIFAMALTRLPKLPAHERVGWFSGAMLVAWGSWVGGTALGAFSGEELTAKWPALGEVTAFALPALFLVLLAPSVTSRRWFIALGITATIATLLALGGFNNIAIPIAAMFGWLCFYALNDNVSSGRRQYG